MYVVENKHIFPPLKVTFTKKKGYQDLVQLLFASVSLLSVRSVNDIYHWVLWAASDHRLQERELTFGPTKTIGLVMTLRPFEVASF